MSSELFKAKPVVFTRKLKVVSRAGPALQVKTSLCKNVMWNFLLVPFCVQWLDGGEVESGF